MMEMGARCPSKFLAPKIEEFPRTNKHFCWKFGYTELWDTTTLPPKSCCLPLPCCQFLPEILWKTASAYIVTWSTFHRSPNGDASLKTAFHGIEQSRWTLPKVHFDPKEQRGILEHILFLHLVILLPFWNNMYIWKCTARQQKNISKLAARIFFYIASIINHDRLKTTPHHHLISRMKQTCANKNTWNQLHKTFSFPFFGRDDFILMTSCLATWATSWTW